MIQLLEALELFAACTLLFAILGGISDWLNHAFDERLYKFPSRKSFYYSFTIILAVYIVSFWLAYLVLQLI